MKGGPEVREFPCSSEVKNLLAMQETQVQSLGWEDPLEKGTAIHSSIRIPWMEEPGELQSMKSQRAGVWLPRSLLTYFGIPW